MWERAREDEEQKNSERQTLELIKAVEWSCESVEPPTLLHAKRSLWTWNKPGTLHESSRAFETCHSRSFGHAEPSATYHSLSGVLHGRQAAVRSRSAKNIWRLADHCRQSSVDLGVEMILGGGALCSRRHLINPTHRDYPRFLSTNAYSYWLCASLCTICLISIAHLVFEMNGGQRAVCWRASAARPGYN